MRICDVKGCGSPTPSPKCRACRKHHKERQEKMEKTVVYERPNIAPRRNPGAVEEANETDQNSAR